MKGLRLALSFVRIPKLFLSLFLYPLIIGIFVAIGAIALTTAYINSMNISSEKLIKDQQEGKESGYIRLILFGKEDPLEKIQVCRWIKKTNPNNEPIGEQPPHSLCEIRPLDAAVITNNTENFVIDEYVKLYEGSTRSIHICNNCKTDIVINVKGQEPITHIYNPLAAGVLILQGYLNEEFTQHFVDAFEVKERIEELEGEIIFSPPGTASKINLTTSQETMAIIINVSFFMIVLFWLALKAHRKVLSYFSQNNVLLPLVAACGKNDFYNALWVITGVRVFCFLLASIPCAYLLYEHFLVLEEDKPIFTDTTYFILWLLGAFSSLGAAATISSIGELRHRRLWDSFYYRYLPLLLCIIGTILWVLSILSKNEYLQNLQYLIQVIPIIGLSPILLAPIVPMKNFAMLIHIILSLLIATYSLKISSKWFAEHLGEI